MFNRSSTRLRATPRRPTPRRTAVGAIAAALDASNEPLAYLIAAGSRVLTQHQGRQPDEGVRSITRRDVTEARAVVCKLPTQFCTGPDLSEGVEVQLHVSENSEGGALGELVDERVRPSRIEQVGERQPVLLRDAGARRYSES